MYHRDGRESIWILIAVAGVGMLLTWEYLYCIVKMLEVVK